MTGGVRVAPMENHNDAKSIGSYRSTHTTRSSVLERAREYNRRIDEQKSRRAKSLERQSDAGDDAISAASGTPRSMSAGRMPSNFQGNRPATRERAMASLNRESLVDSTNPNSNKSQDTSTSDHRSFSSNRGPNSSKMEPSPRSRVSGASAYSSHVSRPEPTTPRMSGGQEPQQPARNHVPTPSHQPRSRQQNNNDYSLDSARSSNVRSSNENSHSRNAPVPRGSPSRSVKSSLPNNKEENHEAVVTPELLVDALSGHEDGLLAIAERLMEHYDSGYDVMGEAIIDAFADVQKLFQHVVEAAHMEGAAFEASRKEEEITELRKQAAAAGSLNELNADAVAPPPNGAPGPSRHDEFVDQDVKDILTEAIRKGTNYRNTNKFSECYQLYEQACHSASALLPVDSDHRGRLQLSIARAESMSHERACAILRYAMDDVLRSGLRAGSVPLPDPSQRADVVLNRPKGVVTGTTGVQSSEEALNSLVEEMREVLQAPVYNNTPLQDVAKRFLAALAEAQKAQQKNEEKLEQNLAKLKGDFLLARAEWEEKLNSTQETAEAYKEKYQKLKESVKRGGGAGSDPNDTTSTNGSTYFDHARSALASQQQRVGDDDTYGGFSSVRSSASKAGSHAGSLGSGLANHARSIVGSFACAGGNVRSGGVVAQELAEHRDAEIREMAFRHDSGSRDRDRRNARRQSGNQSISQSYSDRSFSSESQSQTPRGQPRINTNHTPHSVASGSIRSKSSRSFREYSRSPQRVDF